MEAPASMNVHGGIAVSRPDHFKRQKEREASLLLRLEGVPRTSLPGRRTSMA